MEEIKVGDYVRTDKGYITKAYEGFIDGLISGKSSFGKAIKHSPNIIDLIEERRLCKWRKGIKC